MSDFGIWVRGFKCFCVAALFFVCPLAVCVGCVGLFAAAVYGLRFGLLPAVGFVFGASDLVITRFVSEPTFALMTMFHLVQVSPWPLITGILCFVLTSSFVLLSKFAHATFLLLAVVALFVVCGV